MSSSTASQITPGITPSERDDVLMFWFGFTTFGKKDREAKRASEPIVDGDHQAQWWKSSEGQDLLIRKRFGTLHARLAAQSASTLWAAFESPEDVVAVIIVLDQFSRQIHRDEPEAFAQDALARNLCKRALLAGLFETMAHPLCTLFGLMPLMHPEEAQDQARNLELMERLAMTVVDEDPAIPSIQGSVRAAKDHKKVIDAFGRFPKRNPALGRTSTAKEKQHQRTEGPV